ncbi:Structural maintenance of chromosomes protein 6B [Sarracenia purpurea var. burkii]
MLFHFLKHVIVLQSLVDGDMWAVAVESAVGKLLNAFIVTDHRDSILLRGCAREAGYNHLQIIIYDFARPRLHIPNHMLPQTLHPTTISVIHSDNPTVLNVLVDLGKAERQVLVRNYDVGKKVAFDQRIMNLKEVYTSDGYKMFSRASAQTILPPNKRARTSRLCGSYDDQIKNLERDALNAQEQAQLCRGKKRNVEEALQELTNKHQSAKRRCVETERLVMHKKLALQDAKKLHITEAGSAPASTVDELLHEISKIQDDIKEKETLLEKTRVRMEEAETKASYLKVQFEDLCESAKGEIDAFEGAEHELMLIEEDLRSTEAEKIHYEKVMNDKVLPEVKEAEAQYQELKKIRTESYRKASIICPESDIEALEGYEGSTPEQLSAHLSRLNQRLQRESERYSESVEDLRMLYEKKERKILRRQQTYKAFREKLNACQKALELRWSKFQRNAIFLKRQLTWQFNGHLRKKGINGYVKVSYEEETLSIEVKMPQDASNNSVRDTRGLSGGERSFSTLCFALALHEMTEAPFRAMDEFDVFMDAVSRKISLDTLLDFALAQGSQWIFITPHDISMVKQGERIKKQQMAAPGS